MLVYVDFSSIALKIKNMANKLGLIDDYIVEQGEITTTGTAWYHKCDWYYEKWNSGFVKLIGIRKSEISLNEWMTWGSLYHVPVSGSVLPFTLKELWSCDAKIRCTDGSYTLINGYNSTSNTPATTSNTGGFAVFRPVKPSGKIEVTVQYEVFGKWKLGGAIANLHRLFRRWCIC